MKIFKKLLSVFLAAALTVSAAPMSAAAESEDSLAVYEEEKEASLFDNAVELEEFELISGISEVHHYYKINIPKFGKIQFRCESGWHNFSGGIMNTNADYVVAFGDLAMLKDYSLSPGTYYIHITSSYWNVTFKNFYYKFDEIASPTITSVLPGNGSARLSWKAVDGAEKYAIYTYSNRKFKLYRNTMATSYTVSGLTNGTKYGFLVKAYVDGAWTPYTSADIVYATPVNKPVVTAYAGNGRVRLNWGKISGATKYAIYTYVDGKYSLYRATTANYYNVTGLTNGTKYGFLVKAYVGGKWTSYNTYDLAYATPIDKPVITKAVAANGRVRLYWNKVAGATKYAVFTYSGGKYKLYRNTTANAYTVSGLTNGTAYGFLVRAYVNGKWTTYNAYDRVSATPKA